MANTLASPKDFLEERHLWIRADSVLRDGGDEGPRRIAFDHSPSPQYRERF